MWMSYGDAMSDNGGALSEPSAAVARLYLDAVASANVASDMGVSVSAALELVLERLVDIPGYIGLGPDGESVNVGALVEPAVLLLSMATENGWGVEELRRAMDFLNPPPPV